MHTPTVIAAFRSSTEAAAARSALLANGIEADSQPRTEDMERLCPDLFDDGYDVIVDRQDADRAIALLRRLWPDELPAATDTTERCPACGSPDIARFPRLRLFLASAALLFATSIVFGQRDLFLLATAIIAGVLLLAPNRRCRECGERWSSRKDPP